MLFHSAFLLLMATAVPGAPDSQSLDADEVLAKAYQARAEVRFGELLIHRSRRHAGHEILTVEKCEFDQEHFRVELLAHSDFERMHAAQGIALSGSVGSAIWDGKLLKVEQVALGRRSYRIGSVKEVPFALRDPRAIGLPSAPGEDFANLRKRFRCGNPAARAHREGDNYVVRLPETRSGPAIVELTISPAQGWSLVGAHIVCQAQPDVVYEVFVTLDVSRHGEYWFPRRCLFETTRNGVPYSTESEEIEVLSLGQPIAPDRFDWSSMNLVPGQQILSFVPGVNHVEWDGSKAGPLRYDN